MQWVTKLGIVINKNSRFFPHHESHRIPTPKRSLVWTLHLTKTSIENLVLNVFNHVTIFFFLFDVRLNSSCTDKLSARLNARRSNPNVSEDKRIQIHHIMTYQISLTRLTTKLAWSSS